MPGILTPESLFCETVRRVARKWHPARLPGLDEEGIWANNSRMKKLAGRLACWCSGILAALWTYVLILPHLLRSPHDDSTAIPFAVAACIVLAFVVGYNFPKIAYVVFIGVLRKWKSVVLALAALAALAVLVALLWMFRTFRIILFGGLLVALILWAIEEAVAAGVRKGMRQD